MSGFSILREFCRAAPKHVSGRAQRGLFAGKDKMFGNNVSFSQRKTRRAWKPNVQKKRLYSEALDDFIKFNVTTHALRCIDKMGGLDNYLLRTPLQKLRSTQGERARVRVQEALKQKRVLEREAAQEGAQGL